MNIIQVKGLEDRPLTPHGRYGERSGYYCYEFAELIIIDDFDCKANFAPVGDSKRTHYWTRSHEVQIVSKG